MVDVPCDNPVVVPLLGKVRIVVVHALVRQQQGTFHVVLNRALFRREREEKLVEAAHVFPCLCRTVLRKVLRECQHQRLAVVQYVDFFPLPLRKAVGTPHAPDRYHGTKGEEDDTEQAYLPERCFDVLE